MKESFGAGQLPSPKALAVDSTDYSVYVAVEGGIAAFRSKPIPDITPKPASVGQNDAVLTAHLDPIGAGNITGCEVEYGPTNSYGSTAACDQSLPLTQAGDATVHLAGLETETPYHYRFRAANGNGTTNGPDRTFTPHWVAGLETGDATDIGPGAATMHGELNPSGESTHYYFEWGETKSYGSKTPAAPGAVTSAGALTQVEASLAGAAHLLDDLSLPPRRRELPRDQLRVGSRIHHQPRRSPADPERRRDADRAEHGGPQRRAESRIRRCRLPVPVRAGSPPTGTAP